MNVIKQTYIKSSHLTLFSNYHLFWLALLMLNFRLDQTTQLLLRLHNESLKYLEAQLDAEVKARPLVMQETRCRGLNFRQRTPICLKHRSKWARLNKSTK